MPQEKRVCRSTADGFPANVSNGAGAVAFLLFRVEYLGSISVLEGQKLEKSYGCTFTCPQTRAVHLKVTVKLETDFFFIAQIRFEFWQPMGHING